MPSRLRADTSVVSMARWAHQTTEVRRRPPTGGCRCGREARGDVTVSGLVPLLPCRPVEPTETLTGCAVGPHLQRKVRTCKWGRQQKELKQRASLRSHQRPLCGQRNQLQAVGRPSAIQTMACQALQSLGAVLLPNQPMRATQNRHLAVLAHTCVRTAGQRRRFNKETCQDVPAD